MLELIDLDIPLLGYTKFISTWLYQGKTENFLVDPGPACTAATLFDALEQRGVERLDWILLTHIHMDHSGGIGHVINRFPKVRVVCHERAVKHLINPDQLWEGSLKVLGKVAQTYGRIKPVPAENIITAQSVLFEDGIRVIPTPGHAVHHQCFIFKDWLFCGELFGIMLALNGHIYLRPATPPRIDLKALFESMDRIEPEINREVCSGHYGTYPDGNRIAQMAREQLRLWVDTIKQYSIDSDKKIIMAALMDNDPVYAFVRDLPAHLQERERFFSFNAIAGILQAVNSV